MVGGKIHEFRDGDTQLNANRIIPPVCIFGAKRCVMQNYKEFYAMKSIKRVRKAIQTLLMLNVTKRDGRLMCLCLRFL